MAGLAVRAIGQAPTDENPPPAPLLSMPTIVSGTVTLPYGELKALWEAAQPKPAPPPAAKAPTPPMAFSVQSARYGIDLDADGRQATGQAVFEVLNFAEGWTAVPLLPAKEVRLSSVEPEGALVTVRDGVYTLLLDRPGRRAITLRFSADLPDGDAPRTRALHLTGPSALVSELSLTGIPEGRLAEVRDAARASAPAADGNDKTNGSVASAFFHLAAGQPLSLTLVSAQDRKPAPPPTPSVWQAEAQSLVRYDEGQLVYQTRLRASADSGAGLTLELALPAAASVLSISGADLDRWRTVKSDSGPGETRRLEITWKTPDILRRELLLSYEVPQTALDGDWRLVSPQIASEGGRLRDALYALPMIDGAEFLPVGEGGGPLPPGDARQLPHWLARELKEGNFVLVSAAQSAPADNRAAFVRVRRLPLMRTAQATIVESRFRTRLVADGALLSEGAFDVRHDGPLTLGLALPEDAQLLSCSINRRDALPVDRGGGRIDLSLPAGAAGKTTRIEISYTGRQRPLAPVAGQIALSLPQTDLFVQTLFWDLQIPDAYELTALEGNVEMAPAVAPAVPNAPPAIRLRKELLKAERPTAELFYQKRAVTP
jgi:hypothetical protein